MKISVIIPTWNRADILPRALDSVLNQTQAPHEVIVVDDGSTDKTADIVKESYPQVDLIVQSNAGVSSARNTGIRNSSGDWIALLDSDDEWLSNKLAIQSNAIEQVNATDPDSKNNTRFCHCDEIWIRNGVRVNPHIKHQKKGGWIYAHCLPLCAISPSAALIKKDLFDDLGLFDESLPACEDYDMWLRICAVEPVLYIDNKLLRKHGGHVDQLSRKHWGMDRFRMKALAKIIESNALDPTNLKLTQIQLQEKLTIFVNGAKKRGKLAAALSAEKRYLPLI